jgi:hypothetical protein
MERALYETWVEVVRECFSTDRSAQSGWGLAGRYEARRYGRVLSHEARLKLALQRRMSWRGRPKYFDPSGRGDGCVSIGNQKSELWYELKSIYSPHFHGEKHPHNHDYERFLRLGHPCGALSDVERLRRLPRRGGPAEKVFLLLMISWGMDRTVLPAYERHRKLLCTAFMTLARLGRASTEFSVRSKPKGPAWSCTVKAWRL